jgi:hypothetical protein
MNLTAKELKSAKQEGYCKARGLKGKNQSDAYRLSYNAGNMKPETINRKACELEKDGKVKARIDYLRSSLTEDIKAELVYTASESFKELERLKELSTGLEKPDVKAAIKAEELRGKLARLYVEQREHSGSITTTVKHDTVLGRITDILGKSDKGENR